MMSKFMYLSYRETQRKHENMLNMFQNNWGKAIFNLLKSRAKE